MADFACERPLHKGASAVNRPARRLRRAAPAPPHGGRFAPAGPGAALWSEVPTFRSGARPIARPGSADPPPHGTPGSALGLRPFGPETVHRTVSKTGLTPRQALIGASTFCSIWTLWKNHRQCRLSGKAPAQAGGCPAELLCRSLCERVGALPGQRREQSGRPPLRPLPLRRVFKQIILRARRLQPQMPPRLLRQHPSARGALNQALLQQVRLNHLFQRIAAL